MYKSFLPPRAGFLKAHVFVHKLTHIVLSRWWSMVERDAKRSGYHGNKKIATALETSEWFCLIFQVLARMTCSSYLSAFQRKVLQVQDSSCSKSPEYGHNHHIFGWKFYYIPDQKNNHYRTKMYATWEEGFSSPFCSLLNPHYLGYCLAHTRCLINIC